ncbi:hypothetical protein XENOCAPTIV_004076, partial [Xenoophorus captivus]
MRRTKFECLLDKMTQLQAEAENEIDTTSYYWPDGRSDSWPTDSLRKRAREPLLQMFSLTPGAWRMQLPPCQCS